MSAQATVRRSSARKANESAAPAETAPAETAPAAPESVAVVPAPAASDTYPGALPPAETAPAEIPGAIPAAEASAVIEQTLQEAVGTEQGAAPPRVSADDVAKTQKTFFEHAIGLAQNLATAENRTIIDMARDLRSAIDAFKPIIPKADWWRQRADTLEDFGRTYRLRMNGRTAEPYKWLTCLAVYDLGSEDSKAIILTGRGGRPFPISTIDAIGDWVVYTKADDTYAIKAGFENHLDAIIAKVADEGMTAAQTREAMTAIEKDVRLARAERIGGDKGKAKEAKAQSLKAKAARGEKITAAVGRLAKTLRSEEIGGASASEVLNRLADAGLCEATGLIDPETMTPTEALAFANRLCELDRVDVIYVILHRLRAYEAKVLADKQDAKAPAPTLDDTPSANGAPKADG